MNVSGVGPDFLMVSMKCT